MNDRPVMTGIGGRVRRRRADTHRRSLGDRDRDCRRYSAGSDIDRSGRQEGAPSVHAHTNQETGRRRAQEVHIYSPTSISFSMSSCRWVRALTLSFIVSTVMGAGPPGKNSMEAGEGMQLTPWWPLDFSLGETVQVDCGVWTGGLPSSTHIKWMDPSEKVIHTSDRVQLELRNRNSPNDTTFGAFSVLTLVIQNLTTLDAGVYMCISTASLNGSLGIDSRNITLRVHRPADVCTFESSAMCGWTNVEDGEAPTLSWRHHDGSDRLSIHRTKGLRYDHTYGASKHEGHVIDVDIGRDRPGPDAVARLQSPIYEAHDKPRCLHFWYIYYSRDHGHLSLSVQHMNASSGELLYWHNTTEHKEIWDGEWKLATVTMPPQSRDHRLVFEAQTCTGRCKSGSIALDDFRLFDGKCNEVKHVWADRRLRVRLLGGPTHYEGRVEVLHDGMWGSVCSTQFGDKEARVICESLNFRGEGAVARRKSPYGKAADHVIIWVKKLGCGWDEENLGSCLSKGETWGDTTNCTHDDDASVLCGEVAPGGTIPFPNAPSSTQVAPVAITTTSTADLSTLPTETITTETATTLPETTAVVMTTVTLTTVKTPVLQSTTTANFTTTQTTHENPTTSTKLPTAPPSGQELHSSDVPTGVATATGVETERDGNYTPKASTTDTGGGQALPHPSSNTGAAVAISLVVLLLAACGALWVYKRRRNRRKSKYIVFSNPKYSREHLPANDISLDSPLTSGSSILA